MSRSRLDRLLLATCLSLLSLAGCKDAHRRAAEDKPPSATNQENTNGNSINSGTSETIGVKQRAALLTAANGDGLAGVYLHRKTDAALGVPVDTYLAIDDNGHIQTFVDQQYLGENCYRSPDDASQPGYWLDGMPLHETATASDSGETPATRIGLQTIVAGISFPVIEARRVDAPSREDLRNALCR